MIHQTSKIKQATLYDTDRNPVQIDVSYVLKNADFSSKTVELYVRFDVSSEVYYAIRNFTTFQFSIQSTLCSLEVLDQPNQAQLEGLVDSEGVYRATEDLYLGEVPLLAIDEDYPSVTLWVHDLCTTDLGAQSYDDSVICGATSIQLENILREITIRLSGTVNIHNNLEYSRYTVHIHNGETWEQYIPHIWDNNKWNQIG